MQSKESVGNAMKGNIQLNYLSIINNKRSSSFELIKDNTGTKVKRRLSSEVNTNKNQNKMNMIVPFL